MKVRLIRDVMMAGPVIKKGHIYQLDSYDKIHEGKIELCIGHGSYFDLYIGRDIEVVDEDVTSA